MIDLLGWESIIFCLFEVRYDGLISMEILPADGTCWSKVRYITIRKSALY